MPELLASLLLPPKYGPVEVLKPYVWVLAISYIASSVATPLIRLVARRWNLVDKPDGFLKPHRRPIAYMGGVAVYVGWLAGMTILMPNAEARQWILGLAVAGGVVLAVGLADDILNVRPITKLVGQLAAAAVLLLFGVGRNIALVAVTALRVIWPDLAWPPWLVVALSVPTTLFLVIAACNATNLLDGLDGLCSGVTGIISVMFLILATHLAMYGYSESGDPVRIAAALAMFGAVCGFLPYNLSPATIFLGDAGSMLLGLFAAAMMLMFGERGIARWVLGSLMIFGLPILDTFLALLRRLRLGRSIFAGDRSHLYDQLVDRGFTVRQTLAISYGLSVFYGVAGVAMILIRARYGLPIYVVIGLVTLYFCYRWGFFQTPAVTPRERAGQAGGRRQEQAGAG